LPPRFSSLCCSFSDVLAHIQICAPSSDATLLLSTHAHHLTNNTRQRRTLPGPFIFSTPSAVANVCLTPFTIVYGRAGCCAKLSDRLSFHARGLFFRCSSGSPAGSPAPTCPHCL
jgi:hypothetical protein